ncbi:MAG: PHD/YefM family antitoxin component YafN of YafNO toxin-antitoxin module [Candidatus Omnitrophota bacterium]|jgi:PHD/YefM family antitoxin component YafN of YafNO toxin-antitoxin module
MLTASKLLKAEQVGVRDLSRDYSEVLKKDGPVVIRSKTDNKKVIVSMDDLLELFELIEDLQDKALLELVRESRDAAARGDKPIPVAKLFSKIRGKK